MKILIVDDIKGWRDYHASVLTEKLQNITIIQAESAKEGYDKLIENTSEPFDLILTDLQMENDFEPKYAGEWFVEQIKTFKNYTKTRVVIISAAYNIKHIAESLEVECLSKTTARNFPDSYNFLEE